MEFRQKAIDDFCRLCAIESQSGVIIYSTEGESLCLEEKIISCLRIEVSRDDLLPKKVCQLCSELLEDYHRFSERAIQVQQTLGHIVGIHTQCGPADDVQLCLMPADVKMESNIIKNELDELALQQNNIEIECDKFDFSLGMEVSSDYQNEEATKQSVLDDFDDLDTYALKGDFSYPNSEESNSKLENVKQNHRRKMTQPKKASSCKTVSHRELEAEKDLIGIEKIKCYSKDENGVKSESINDYFQGGENSNKDKEIDKKDKEETEMERECRKHCGIMCDQCRNIFHTRSLFDKHYKICYNRKPLYTCSFCKMSFTKYSDYRSHSVRHIYEGQFKCEVCDKKFGMKGMLQVHVTTHNRLNKSFICKECRLELPTQKRLTSHQKKHIVQMKKEFHCPECGKVLQTRGGLAAHLTVHKLGRRFMCHLCGKTFTQKRNMQQHVKHHKGEKPYSCEDCGKSFTEKSHLNRHKSFHTLERPYQCPVCKKMYKTERCLKVHSRVHLNTRPYVCSFCGKGFLSSTKLKQHYNCHTGERPFACKYCERTFTNYPNWLKHTRRRHKVDHKTGLSLKEESRRQDTLQTNSFINSGNIPNNGGIECLEIPGAEVKDDVDRDSVQSTVSTNEQPIPQIVPQVGVVGSEDSHWDLSPFPVHSVPELPHTQNTYSVYGTPPYFGLNLREI